MKYSIIISPSSPNSNAADHALRFIESILKQNHCEISVFFYGYSTKIAFEHLEDWRTISYNNNATLFACSTIAEKYVGNKKSIVDYISLAGLGQWMESVHNADKNIEFV